MDNDNKDYAANVQMRAILTNAYFLTDGMLISLRFHWMERRAVVPMMLTLHLACSFLQLLANR